MDNNMYKRKRFTLWYRASYWLIMAVIACGIGLGLYFGFGAEWWMG